MENDSNLSELFPADAAYWSDIEIVPVWEAVLLSLGIEPRTIHDIASQRDYDDETDGLSYGLQEQEYARRVAILRNAIAAKSLAFVELDDPDCIEHISLIGFIAWANNKGWSMPEWMLSMSAPPTPPATPANPSGVRELKKTETQARYQRWQTRAKQLDAAHPSWSVSKIAKKVAEEFNVETSTVRNNIVCDPGSTDYSGHHFAG